MAAWVEKTVRHHEINEYFASINCMSLRIIEDIQKIREGYGSSWENFSPKDQEKRIDEWMVPEDVRKQYPLPEEVGPVVYPTVKLDTGQKIVELQIDQSEFPQTWMDEHSEPFSLQSRSQMDLRLPPPSSKKAKKKKKSSADKEKPQSRGNTTNDDLLSSINGGLLNLKSIQNEAKTKPSYERYGDHNDSEKLATSDDGPKSTKPTADNMPYTGMSDFSMPDFSKDINLDFGVQDLGTYEPESYDIPYTEGVTFPYIESNDVDPTNIPMEKSAVATATNFSLDNDFLENYNPARQYDDVEKYEIPKPEILPSSELSKAYNESEFLDLYPQPKKEAKKPVKHDQPAKSKEVKPKVSKSAKKYERKAAKAPSSPPPPPPKKDSTPPLPVGIMRLKKTHRKKSSGGSNTVNPRSSLTLDGAILNLEIAAEMNKQGMSPQVQHEKVFGDEIDLLKQIEKDTDLESWFTETPSQGSPLLSSHGSDKADNAEVQKTGYDFLDNW